MNNYPDSFKIQSSGIEQYRGLSKRDAAEILKYFMENESETIAVLNSSYNKRFTPSSFIEECKGGYRVGWFHEDREACQIHKDICIAVTDYILFSFGIGRFQSHG